MTFYWSKKFQQNWRINAHQFCWAYVCLNRVCYVEYPATSVIFLVVCTSCLCPMTVFLQLFLVIRLFITRSHRIRTRMSGWMDLWVMWWMSWQTLLFVDSPARGFDGCFSVKDPQRANFITTSVSFETRWGVFDGNRTKSNIDTLLVSFFLNV